MTNRKTLDWYRAKYLDARRRGRSVNHRAKRLHARTHKAASILHERRIDNRILADQNAHVRRVQRFGSDFGERCPDCEHIPRHPWEGNGEPTFLASFAERLNAALDSVSQ